MDGARFDSLTRRFAVAGSRRRFLGGLLAGVVGAAEVGAAEAVACRAVGRLCSRHAHCCSGRCGRDADSRRRCQCQSPGDCPAPPICNIATCDQGVCGVAPTTGGVCGGEPCLAPLVCREGACVAGAPVECPPPDQCHESGVCNPATGACDYAPKPDDTPCDDGDRCTSASACRGGVCVGRVPVACVALDQCHDAVCDPATGGCVQVDKPDGTTCNDDNRCTTGDACQKGVCAGGTPVVCTPSGPCVTANCDTQKGCVETPKAAGASCADDDRCDGDEACDGAGNCGAGTPVNCGACQRCNVEEGTCEADPEQVGDVCTPLEPDACFGGFRCDAGGNCAGVEPVVCAANDACHEPGVCDPLTGDCSYANKPDGFPCGPACTTGGTCSSGVCGGSTPVVCTPSGPCVLRSVCDPATNQCVETPKPAGERCTADDICTVGVNQCDGEGICIGAPVPDGRHCKEEDGPICRAGKCCQQVPSNKSLGAVPDDDYKCVLADPVFLGGDCCEDESTLCISSHPALADIGLRTCCRPVGGACKLFFDCCQVIGPRFVVDLDSFVGCAEATLGGGGHCGGAGALCTQDESCISGRCVNPDATFSCKARFRDDSLVDCTCA